MVRWLFSRLDTDGAGALPECRCGRNGTAPLFGCRAGDYGGDYGSRHRSHHRAHSGGQCRCDRGNGEFRRSSQHHGPHGGNSPRGDRPRHRQHRPRGNGADDCPGDSAHNRGIHSGDPVSGNPRPSGNHRGNPARRGSAAQKVPMGNAAGISGAHGGGRFSGESVPVRRPGECTGSDPGIHPQLPHLRSPGAVLRRAVPDPGTGCGLPDLCKWDGSGGKSVRFHPSVGFPGAFPAEADIAGQEPA